MKKLLSIVLACTLAVAVLASCAPKAPTTSGDTPASAPAPAGDKKTVVYWSMWEATEPQGQAIAQAVESFTKETGIAVDLQFKGRTGIREGLIPALDSGTTIDMFDEDIDRVNKDFAKYLTDLETMAKANDYEKTAIAGLISACREAAGGVLKTIPYQPNVFNVFYNKAIFKDAGVDKEPATWEEFLAACEKIKAKGFIPMTSDDAYIVCNFGYHMSRLVGEAGTTAIVTEGKWDDPAVAQFAKDYEELAKKGYLSPNIGGNVWPAGQNTELALGTAAMYLNGSWLPNEVKDISTVEEWGCFSYPALKGGKDGVEAANYGAQVLAVHNKSTVQDEAFQLITYLTKGAADAKLSEMSIGIPADTTNSEWPALLQGVKPVMDSLSTRYSWAAGGEANADMTPIIKENVLKLCGGSITADEFVANMKKAAK